MFLLPVPEGWEAAAHDWEPVVSELPEGSECFLRGEAGTPSCSVLTIMRSPGSGQRLAWFGPADRLGVVEPVPQGELHAMVGVVPGDWGPEDLPPGERPA